MSNMQLAVVAVLGVLGVGCAFGGALSWGLCKDEYDRRSWIPFTVCIAGFLMTCASTVVLLLEAAK